MDINMTSLSATARTAIDAISLILINAFKLDTEAIHEHYDSASRSTTLKFSADRSYTVKITYAAADDLGTSSDLSSLLADLLNNLRRSDTGALLVTSSGIRLLDAEASHSHRSAAAADEMQNQSNHGNDE
jgi:hypothetical protein